MKSLKLTLLTAIVCVAFKPLDKEFDKALLKENETIEFSNKPVSGSTFTSMSLNVGGYDGSGFKLLVDNQQNIVVSNITQPSGPKQDEFSVVGCTGSLTLKDKKLSIRFEKVKARYYLVSLNEQKVVAEFDSILQVNFQSVLLSGGPGEFYFSPRATSNSYTRSIDKNGNVTESTGKQKPSTPSIRLTAVPKGLTIKELFAEVHAPHTLAHFSEIEVITNNHEVQKFPGGNYILCEGDTFKME